MSVNKLVLLPRDPEATLADTTPLQRSLSACGLIGEALEHAGDRCYATGDHFLQLVTFLGCSPTIELDPPANPGLLEAALRNGEFCHVRLHTGAAMRFRADPATRPPRCPACRAPVTDWQAVIEKGLQAGGDTPWQCPTCEKPSPVTALDFRKTAGCGRIFVDICGIYPSEAVPCDALLETLGQVSGGPWYHIYIKE